MPSDASDTMRFDPFREDAFFHHLVEASPDGVVVVAEGRIVFVNGQVEKLFGYRRDELLGQAVEFLIPERQRDTHPAHRDDYTRNPRSRPMGEGARLAGRRKDGTEFPPTSAWAPSTRRRDRS